MSITGGGSIAAVYSRRPWPLDYDFAPDKFCDEHDMDVNEISNAALMLITREFRGELRGTLSAFFGNDSLLFWVLHSTIWPRFGRPMVESMGTLLGLDDQDIGELQEPWDFVTDGWCDAADQ